MYLSVCVCIYIYIYTTYYHIVLENVNITTNFTKTHKLM